MRWQDIKKYRDRKPFVPFRIVFTDGRTINVQHPDWLFVSQHVLDVGVEGDPGSGVPTETIIGSHLHVVRLEYTGPVPEES